MEESREIPPTLQETLTDGEHGAAWLWGFTSYIPETIKAIVTDNFLYRRLCSTDLNFFHWSFRRLVTQKEARFLRLLQSESYEIDPMVTNFVTELIHSGKEGSQSEDDTQETETTTERQTTTGTEGTSTTAGSGNSGNTRTDNLSVSVTGRAATSEGISGATSGTKANTGTATTTGTGTITTARVQQATESTTRTDDLREDTDLHSRVEKATQEIESGTTTLERDVDTDKSYSKTEAAVTVREVKNVGDPDASTDSFYGRIRKDEGSEFTAHGATDYEKRTATGRNGTREDIRSRSDILSDMPEVDSTNIIAGMQVQAAGTPAAPSLSYASRGDFVTEAEQETFTGYGDTTTESQNGTTWDELYYGQDHLGVGMPRRTLEHEHIDTTTTTTPAGAATGMENESGQTTDTTTHGKRVDGTENAETDNQGSKTTTGTVTTAGQSGGSGTDTETRNTTDTRTDNLTETNSGETHEERTGEETRAETTTNTGTVTDAGTTSKTETTTTRTETEGGGTDETKSKSTGGKTAKEEEESIAYKVLSGRNGYSPQDLLMRFTDFIYASRALEWFLKELEPAFYQVYEEDMIAWI